MTTQMLCVMANTTVCAPCNKLYITKLNNQQSTITVCGQGQNYKLNVQT